MVRISLTLLLATPFAVAQPARVDPPVAGRPEDFSDIVGKYTIDVNAEPRAVHVEDSIMLTVRIKGEGPAKYEPRREHLRILPDWTDDFYVQELPDEHRVLKDDKTWLFVYRLRPKHAKVNEIDGIKLVYFDPDTQIYSTRSVGPINIVVKPKPERAEEPELVRVVPDSFYRLDESQRGLTELNSAFPLSVSSVTALLVTPPLLCLAILFVYRRIFPNEARRLSRRRQRAAQRALLQLQLNDEPAWSVVRRYLHERFDFAVDDPTPADVAAFLKRRGFAKERCTEGLAFFQRCDAVRYTNSGLEPATLRDEVPRLIRTLEADPCARG